MTGALAPVTSDGLAGLPVESREAAVTQYLTGARDWLAKAVEITGPEVIAAVKAEIAIKEAMGVTQPEAAAAAVVEFYNKGRGGKKVPAWWAEVQAA